MTLALASNNTAIGPRLFTYFSASGGTEPYVYSVVAGGVGGSIDPDTGLYTAPDDYGSDTIMVTDDDANTAILPILIGTPEQLLCDIIKTEMELDADQVWLWDQKVWTPTDSRVYVTVSVNEPRPFGSSKRYIGSDESLDAEQSVNIHAMVGIDIMSRSIDALNRKEELLMALNSDYSESQQELCSFRVAPITRSFVNLSNIDGAAIPYRFHLSLALTYYKGKTKAVPYFDTFEDVDTTTEP